MKFVHEESPGEKVISLGVPKMPIIQTMVGAVEMGDADYGDEASQLKRVMQSPAKTSGNIRVAVRVRPPNQREIAGGGGGVCVSVPPAREGVVQVEGANQPFSFDGIVVFLHPICLEFNCICTTMTRVLVSDHDTAPIMN